MRRSALVVPTVVLTLLADAGVAGACAGLIGPGGNVKVLRTSTLAAYTDGVEHYVTSFRFEGGGAEFGSIVPLPAVPSKVERGGDWTLQRLVREVAPAIPTPALAAVSQLARTESADVVLEARVDALDLTVLRGGGAAVGKWARDNGFTLTPDAPEVLDFYAERSPIFLAARFDPAAARGRGQQVGDGTPIHLTIPTDDPWVPLRILGLGRPGGERVEADVFLLTDQAPLLLPAPGSGVASGLVPLRSEPASDQLLADLRSDAGMGWVPQAMWLTYLRLGQAQGDLRYDLAVSTDGDQPSVVAAGLSRPAVPAVPANTAVPAQPAVPANTAVPAAGTTAATTTTTAGVPPATTAAAPATTTMAGVPPTSGAPATAAGATGEAPADGPAGADLVAAPASSAGAEGGGGPWSALVGLGAVVAAAAGAAGALRRRRADEPAV